MLCLGYQTQGELRGSYHKANPKVKVNFVDY